MITKSNTNTGASVILGYSIMLGISVVMVGILLSAFGSQLQAQEDSAIKSELEIAAGQIVAEFEKADATVRNSDATGDLLVRPNFTDRAGDPTFRIELDDTARPNLYILRIESQDLTVEKPFRSQTPVDTSSSADSARLRIKYDESSNQLRLINKGSETIISTQTSKKVSGDYVIPDNSDEEPSVDATGSITGGQDSTVHGHIDAGDSINTDQGLAIYSYARADNTVTMGIDSYVQDNVEAGGNITIGDGSAIGDSIISSSGSVSIGSNSEVSDSIEASGDVTVGQGTRIVNTITSGGVVTLNDDSSVGGEVYVSSSSDIVCGTNVTINGLDCSTYKNNY